MPHVARRAKPSHRLNCEVLEDRSVPAVAFALSGTNLLSFDTASPSITQTTAITGVTMGDTLVGIDFRPQNGLLYGLGINATADTGTLYAISTRTGVATAVGAAGQITFTTDGVTAVDLPDPATAGYGFDFNPAADRVRVTTSTGLNFRINPNTGLGVDGDNGGAANSVTGTNPDGAISGGPTGIDGTAYTNNQPNTTVTTLYTLDAVSNSLFIQNPPNAGTQTSAQTVMLSGAPLDFTAINGFDIPAGVNALSNNAPATGSAFAVLSVGGTTGLYSINLATAAATFVGAVGNGATAVQGFAVQSNLGGFPAVALDSTGTNLVRFNTGSPGTVTSVAITGVTMGDTLVGIDFRPATGQLYAVGVNATADTGTLYILTPQTVTGGVDTASVSAVGTFAFVGADGTTAVDLPDPAVVGYGVDVNPSADRIRVTTSTGLNFRLAPTATAGSVAVDGNLNTTPAPNNVNPDGAINGAGSTGVSAAAYTNSFGGTTVTTLYTIDAAGSKLFIQNPPNAGTQTNSTSITASGAPLTFTDVNGFDIPAGVSVGTNNAAVSSGFGYAVLTVGGATSLYQIDLTTGAATNLGAVGAGTTALAGFALADAPAGTVAFAGATFSGAESATSSGTTTATINLTRTGGTAGALTVTVNVTGGTATGGTDFVTGPYTATFADGSSTASFTITINPDFAAEGNETVNLSIASVNNGAVIGAQNTATLTIADGSAGAVGFASPTFTVNEGAGTVTITLTRTGGVTGSPTVAVNTAPGTATTNADFAAGPYQATFAPGLATASFTVPILEDTLVEGAETFTLSLISATGGATVGSPSTATVSITDNDTVSASTPSPLPPATPPVPVGNTVQPLNADGTLGAAVTPFAGYLGALSTAAIDLNKDGVNETLVGSGFGASHVKVVGANGELASFFAFARGFAGGVRVASGDVNGDGTPDIIVAAGPGAGPHVKVIDGTKLNLVNPDGSISDAALLASFFAYSPSFAGGISVAVGDVNGDGKADIITGTGLGTPAHVKVIDGTKLNLVNPDGSISDAALLASFFAYGPSFVGGVSVAAGDVNGDGTTDVITGAGLNGSGHVKVVDGTKRNLVNPDGSISDAALLRSFLAQTSTVAPVRVAARKNPGGAFADIVVTFDVGLTIVTRVFNGQTLVPAPDVTAADPLGLGVAIV